MKHSEKNEFDLLLRGLAKRERARRGYEEEAQLLTNHLDADELNSYAEDVLPSAARARYTAHLADCSNCRQMVSQLSLAAGAASRPGDHQEQATSFWQKLASLFSPATLKYAMPGLVLLSIAMLGVIVLKQQRQLDFVARKGPVPSTATQTIEDTSEMSGSVDQGSLDKEPVEKSQSQQEAGSNREAQRQEQQAQEKRADQDAPSSSAGEKESVARTVTKAEAERQAAYAPEPTAVAPPPAQAQPKPADTRTAASAAPAKETQGRSKLDSVAVADAEKKREGDFSRAREEQTETIRRPQKAPSPRLGVGSARSNNNEAAKAKDENQVSAETRSVAGRNFRREGNSWVDTAYDASRSVVNIRRGSEQFRALVADEPGLKTVSQELSGVVIVVWKGRAYRIQ